MVLYFGHWDTEHEETEISRSGVETEISRSGVEVPENDDGDQKAA